MKAQVHLAPSVTESQGLMRVLEPLLLSWENMTAFAFVVSLWLALSGVSQTWAGFLVSAPSCFSWNRTLSAECAVSVLRIVRRDRWPRTPSSTGSLRLRISELKAVDPGWPLATMNHSLHKGGVRT